jgi:predicted transcriptional regulator of viral defense system
MREEMRSQRKLALLADEQHGVVTAGQLQELGVSSSAISRWTGAGRLHRVHQGVYAVGRPTPTRHGRCLAAVLACGAGSLLSHQSASWLWAFSTICPMEVEVTTVACRPRRAGIRVHSATLIAADRARFEGIPVTSPACTLLGLAATGSHKRLTGAVDRSKRLGLLRLDEIDALLARRKGAPGTRPLREALEIYRAADFDRARSELLFLNLIEKAGLPGPR